MNTAASMVRSKTTALKLPRHYEEAILREGPDTVGAVVLEPITAGGGVITPPEGYFQGNSTHLP